MTTATELREILYSYPRGVYVIDTLEISHSLLSTRYLLTREPTGLTATLETAETVTFEGTNINIILNSAKNDLDSNFSFTLPDIDNILDDELDLIPLDNTEPIVCIYRSFNSDDLSAPSSIFELEVLNVSQKKGVFTIECGVPQLNWNKTGEIYTYDRFPMLRAL